MKRKFTKKDCPYTWVYIDVWFLIDVTEVGPKGERWAPCPYEQDINDNDNPCFCNSYNRDYCAMEI